MNATAPQAVGMSSRGHKNTLPQILLGLLLVLLWGATSLLEVEATESWLLQGAIVTFIPNWDILLQIPRLLSGHNVTIAEAKAIIFGWGIEFATLVIIVSYDTAKDAVRNANPRIVTMWQSSVVVIFLFNVFTNFQFGSLGSGLLGQIAFAVFVSFISLYFGITGYRMIEHGIKNWR